MKQRIYENIKQKKKKLAVLIDPDKADDKHLDELSALAGSGMIDFFLVGGSLISEHPEKTILYLKSKTDVPVVLFPGSLLQYTPSADAILLLSLISGRNPEFLIGNHVAVAPLLKKSDMEILPTGYMLINTGNTTSVEYISNTTPIPSNKTDIAVATALAGEMLGLKLIYLDAGSGAEKPIGQELIKTVKKNITIPLLVGGGLRTLSDVKNACKSGADVIVVGTTVEKSLEHIPGLAEIIHTTQTQW